VNRLTVTVATPGTGMLRLSCESATGAEGSLVVGLMPFEAQLLATALRSALMRGALARKWTRALVDGTTCELDQEFDRRPPTVFLATRDEDGRSRVAALHAKAILPLVSALDRAREALALRSTSYKTERFATQGSLS
jgi:hypothetical protein